MTYNICLQYGGGETELNRKVPVGISIPLDLLERIDQGRGRRSRSEFVVQLIEMATVKRLENK